MSNDLFSHHARKNFDIFMYTPIYDVENGVFGRTSYYGDHADANEKISATLAKGYHVELETFNRCKYRLKPTGPTPEYVVNDYEPVSYALVNQDTTYVEKRPPVLGNKYTIIVDVEYYSRVPSVRHIIVTLANGQTVIVSGPSNRKVLAL